MSANGDGTGNAATTEETQKNVAHNIAELVANAVNNGGVNTFNHGNAIEFRSDNKVKRLEIEVSNTPIGGGVDDGQPGDMVIDNGSNDGDNSHNTNSLSKPLNLAVSTSSTMSSPLASKPTSTIQAKPLAESSAIRSHKQT